MLNRLVRLFWRIPWVYSSLHIEFQLRRLGDFKRVFEGGFLLHIGAADIFRDQNNGAVDTVLEKLVPMRVT